MPRKKVNEEGIGPFMVKIGDTLHFCNEPIMLVFPNDEIIKSVGNLILNIKPRKAMRKIFFGPNKTTTTTMKKFMKLNNVKIATP